MRKTAIIAVVSCFGLIVAGDLMAYRPPPATPAPPPSASNVYHLFLHGRSGDNHCRPLNSVNDGQTDYKNYWGGTVTGLSNVRYVGFDGTRNGGAYSWSSCGAQSQLHAALNTFCRGSNRCKLYTHSTGGLVAAYYFYASGSSGLNLLDVRLMANASGGSELADISTTYLGWLGFDTLGGELDESVSTGGARSWNHNNTGGLTFDTTSGEASDYWGVTSPFLPGEDDGVLANHTLCGINKVASIDRSCPIGSGSLSESYRCGFLWLSTCHRTYYRWSGYFTVLMRSSDTHGDAKKHYR
ncbi:MAG: hypothetical protein H7A21_05925 [Spirochaetales bacterium]|nr:hypothetical protein [Leptospiraceae bacterium]MCP5480948.1 hypothetical protein [Spirochaetales bacterium]MCP5485328.1 hypothetical protein [Spirochaetales bacterium]